MTCRDLAIEFRNIHQIRHSVATFLISESVPLGDVAKFLGDTVETVVKTYLHPAGTDPSDTLDRALGGQSVGKVGINSVSVAITISCVELLQLRPEALAVIFSPFLFREGGWGVRFRFFSPFLFREGGWGG